MKRKMPRLALQKGSVLLVSLIMLLLISLIAVGGIQGTILQERMTGNMRDRDLAFQAAEAALRDAERYLRNNPNVEFNNANGLYEINSLNRPDWRTRDIDEGNGARAYGGENIEGVSAQPEYFIEEIDSLKVAGTETEVGVELPPIPYFRITARGFGGSANTSVVLSSVYRNQ